MVQERCPQEGLFTRCASPSRVLSVPIPFRGDYVGLQGNPKLQKLKGGEEGPVLVADTVKKVNRGNGKVKSCGPQTPVYTGFAGRGVGATPVLILHSPLQTSARILLLTERHLILTDAKKSQAQIVVALEDVAGVSVTSLQDGLFSLHLSEVFARHRWAVWSGRPGAEQGWILTI